MLPVEIVCMVEQQNYVIVEHFATSFYIEMQGFLIFDKSTLKFNFYVLDYFNVPDPWNATKIVDSFQSVPLEIAQQCYPSYNLTEENYGF